MQKRNNVHNTLLRFLFYGMCFVMVLLSLHQGISIYFSYKDTSENIQSNLKKELKQNFTAITQVYGIVKENSEYISNSVSKEVIKKYEESKNINFDLNAFVDLERDCEIYIIDESNTIVKTTNEETLGLDFSNWEGLKNELDDLRITGESKIKSFSNSAITGELYNFFYYLTSDRKYIVEIGIPLNNYSEYISNFKIENLIFETAENSGIVENIKLFDMYGSSLNDLKEVKSSKDEFDFIQDTIISEKSIKNKISWFSMEEYIPVPLSEEDVSVLKISYNFKPVYISFFKKILSVIIICLLAIILFFWVIRKKLRALISPIDDIVKGINAVSNGDYSVKLNVNTDNEFETIANVFNTMVKKINEGNEQLGRMYEEQAFISQELERAIADNTNIYFETIRTLANAIDAKDSYTKGHCDRVTEYSLMIAREMRLSEKEITHLVYGSSLHDIGKIGIPENILNKNSRLSDEEFEIIKTHPRKGYEILKDVDFLTRGRKIVYQHHERYDGKGYPRGLKGEEIDILARIVCIADSFDAMLSNRSYRNSLTYEKAISELKKGRGSQFDPQITDILLTIVEDKICKEIV